MEQRPGDATNRALDLQSSATTFARRIIPESTRARVHRRGQHERSWKRERHRRAADRDFLIFDRLAQDFEDAAIELRQLIKKQNALMRERNFASAWHCAPARSAA